jgi:hypothetical protein
MDRGLADVAGVTSVATGWQASNGSRITAAARQRKGQVMKRTQIRIQPRQRPRRPVALDLRTPSGRVLPF